MLRDKGIFVSKKQSHEVDEYFITKNKKNFFIVANFCNLSTEVKARLKDEYYVIYEHDHKYLKGSPV